MKPGGQVYYSMADYEGVAASCKDAMLPETLDLVLGKPNWTVSEYCTRYGRILDACWFAGMFSNGRSKTMIDRRGFRHGTDTGTRERRWSWMRL